MEFTRETTSSLTLGVPTQEDTLASTQFKTDQGIRNVIFGSVSFEHLTCTLYVRLFFYSHFFYYISEMLN